MRQTQSQMPHVLTHSVPVPRDEPRVHGCAALQELDFQQYFWDVLGLFSPGGFVRLSTSLLTPGEQQTLIFKARFQSEQHLPPSLVLCPQLVPLGTAGGSAPRECLPARAAAFLPQVGSQTSDRTDLNAPVPMQQHPSVGRLKNHFLPLS